MKDEAQSPQEETPNTYWRWLVESWRYPLGHNPAEKWYGVVTLLGEDIVLFIGLAVAGNYIANLFDMPLVHHGSGATFWAIVILFVVQLITILCSMVGHLFVFGNTGGFWQYVNKVAQVTNWNFWIAICAFFFLNFEFKLRLAWIWRSFSLDFLCIICIGIISFSCLPRSGNGKDDSRPILGSSYLLSNGSCSLCHHLGHSIKYFN